MALWLWNASLLTTAADQNLRIIKTLTQLLPPDWASKAESAFRIFGADRALLLVEGIAIAKLIMSGARNRTTCLPSEPELARLVERLSQP